MPVKKKTAKIRQVGGRHVNDATKPLVLKIAKADIHDSTPGDPANCAVAVACKRLIGADEVLVYKTRAYVRRGNTWTRYMVPSSIQGEIRAFDRGAEFVPADYTLVPPSRTEKLGRVRGEKGGEIKTNRDIRRKPIRISRESRPDAPAGGVGMRKALGVEVD
jgi:hypothetical protein